jgi:SAM-dependent methyltransferase
MRIPGSAVKYILFQRTAYLRLPNTRVYRALSKILPFGIYNPTVAIESVLSRARVKSLYQDDMRREYSSIEPFLPRKCTGVLDIGCGVGGLAFFLYQHYHADPVQLYLLDKTCLASHVYYLFAQKAAFYNSLDVAKVLLTGSGVEPASIHLIEASDNNDIGVMCKVELVLSLISWGFHYPIATYLDRVYDMLAEEGVVILDVRKNTDGMETLRKRFRDIRVILEREKYTRVVAKK